MENIVKFYEEMLKNEKIFQEESFKGKYWFNNYGNFQPIISRCK